MDTRTMMRFAIAILVGCGWLQLPPRVALGQQDGMSEPASSAEAPEASTLDKLLDMADQDMSELTRVQVAAPALDMEVTSVSRQVSTVGRSPAAVFVITNEMIRRSGARSIPEILRMAPGVQVARIDASKWAISIRGFSGRFSNKLLVQIDGRSVYTPLFGGVFWDVQDVVLEDIERIEVIRGPGATVWGANAVNGIINIITKNTTDTQGMLVQGGDGRTRFCNGALRRANRQGRHIPRLW
jgi:iron complex outermembrane receptor protein